MNKTSDKVTARSNRNEAPNQFIVLGDAGTSLPRCNAGGSELLYLEGVEQRKSTGTPNKFYRVCVQMELMDYEEGAVADVGEPVELKVFRTVAAAEKFIRELEDFA